MKQFLKSALFISLVYISNVSAQNTLKLDDFDDDLLFEIDETDTSDNPIKLVGEVSIVDRLHNVKDGIYDTWETGKFMGDVAKNIIKNIWLEKKYDWYGDVSDISLLQKSLVSAGASAEFVRMLGDVAIMASPILKDKVKDHLAKNAIKYVVGMAVLTSIVTYKKCERETFLKVLAAEGIAGVIIGALRMCGMKETVAAGAFEKEKDSDEEGR